MLTVSPDQAEREGKEALGVVDVAAQKHLSPNQPEWLVAFLVAVSGIRGLLQGEFVQTNILHRGPNDAQATGFRREHVNLVSALSHIAEQAFDGIGGLNMPMHRLRELVKGQEMLFILPQAAHRFWIAFAVFGGEGPQLDDGLWLGWLLPDAGQFSLHLPTFSSRDRVQDVALFMH